MIRSHATDHKTNFCAKVSKIPSKLEISKDTTLCAKICRKLFQTQKIFKPQTGRNYKIQKKRIKNS
jgi:hypothetical protein